MHDPVAWAQAVKAAITVLEAARPEGDAKPDWLWDGEGEFPPEELAANLGETLAERFLAALARPEYGFGFAHADLARFAGEKLGSEITARIDARLQWAEPRNPIHERAAAEDRSNGDEATPEG